MPAVASFSLLSALIGGATGTPVFQYPSEIMSCLDKPPIQKTFRMTRCEYNDIVNAVITTYRALPTRCDEQECLQSDFAGCVLRMAGHDFLDYNPDSGLGGSDGCVDLQSDINRGLAKCLHDGQFGLSLNQAYQPFCQTVSTADFFVIAAEAVMMATRRNAQNEGESGFLKFADTFKYGRTTQKTCPDAMPMPNPEESCSGLEKLQKNMGLNSRRAITALSGAHTLGRARLSQSGYEGWWSGPEESRNFDNRYYRNMVSRGWYPKPKMNGKAGKNQWSRVDTERTQGQNQMMLNTDLCLVYSDDNAGSNLQLHAETVRCCAWTNLKPTVTNDDADTSSSGEYFCGAQDTEESSKASCCEGAPVPDVPNCQSPQGGGGFADQFVMEFANDDGVWIAAFMESWVKATEMGHNDLNTLEVCYDASTGSSGNLHFNCTAGEKYWKRGWSELKRGFCCKNAGVGCEMDLECTGSTREMKNWDPAKKARCCRDEDVGCQFAYNCSAGLRNWQSSWSAEKMEYCCRKQKVGCAAAAGNQVKFDASVSKVWTEPRLVATCGVPALLVAGLLGVAAIKRRRSGASLLTSEASGTDHDPEPFAQPEE